MRFNLKKKLNLILTCVHENFLRLVAGNKEFIMLNNDMMETYSYCADAPQPIESLCCRGNTIL